MAKITREQVLKFANLSMLELSESEMDSYVKELEQIIEYIEHIDQVDTDGLEPTDQVTGLENIMREDVVLDYQASSDDLLKIVPKKEKNSIKVKRVLN